MTVSIKVSERISRNKNYLNGEMLSDGNDLIVRIKDVLEETVTNPQSGKTSNEIILHFDGDVKPLPLTANCQWENIKRATGENDTINWPGKKIQLYGEYGLFYGKMQWAVRVREFAPQG